MSNRAISVYAEALKREKEETKEATTHSSSEATAKPKKQEGQLGKDADKHVRKQARKEGPKRAKKRGSTDARMRARTYQRVRKAVVNRSRLGGCTFRYQPEELDRLDEVAHQVNKGQDIKVSKNDIARIALLWLLEDYDENKRESVLASVLTQMRR